MSLTSLIILVVVGLVAGWLAGQIFRGAGFGLIGNLIVGVLGSFLGWFIYNTFHLGRIINLGSSLIGELIVAVLGAILLLWIISLIKRR